MLRSRLAAIASLALVGVGAGTYLMPDLVASIFGIPADSDRATLYLRGLGARNAVLGALVATFLARGELSALRWTLGWTALAGVSDFTLVALERGSAVRANLVVHASGALGLAALCVAFGDTS